ncbi:MAG: alpha/beta hydrolase [Mediterranea massiliensis]|nr:alpha/beta hydrolase [Mediterranea massiliensis]
MKKKIIIGSIVLLALLCVATIFIGNKMLDYSLKPEALHYKSRNIEGSIAYMKETYPKVGAWIDSLQAEGAIYSTYLTNREGTNLHALMVPAKIPTHKTAIIVHGYTDNAIRMLMIGYLYSKGLGYNILLPDLYAHGMSEGTEIQMGWKDRLDVLEWIEHADELFGRQNVEITEGDSTYLYSTGIQAVVHGISMGAATTMMVAGEVEKGVHQLPYVKCFVADCGYTSVWDEFAGFGFPTFPLLNVASYLCKQKYGWGFKEASALESIKQSHRPMLFIHGDADDYVPTWMVHPLYEAKPEPKELWLSPGIDHANSYRDLPEEYTLRVKKFVDKYIH